MAMIITDENRSLLREGRALAARIPTERQGWLGWTWVCPVMHGDQTFAEARETWTRDRLAAPYDGTIERFKVRKVELSDWHLDDSRFLDMDYAILERPITDEPNEVTTEVELEAWLMANSVAPGSLADPESVDYPDPPIVRPRGGEG